MLIEMIYFSACKCLFRQRGYPDDIMENIYTKNILGLLLDSSDEFCPSLNWTNCRTFFPSFIKPSFSFFCWLVGSVTNSDLDERHIQH